MKVKVGKWLPITINPNLMGSGPGTLVEESIQWKSSDPDIISPLRGKNKVKVVLDTRSPGKCRVSMEAVLRLRPLGEEAGSEGYYQLVTHTSPEIEVTHANPKLAGGIRVWRRKYRTNLKRRLSRKYQEFRLDPDPCESSIPGDL